MTNKTVKVEVGKLLGNELPQKLTGSFDINLYDSRNEIKAEDLLNDDEYVQAVNAGKVQSQRAKVTAKLLETAAKEFTAANPDAKVNPYEKPSTTTPEGQRTAMIKMYMKLHGIDEETATTLVDGAAAQVAALKAAK